MWERERRAVGGISQGGLDAMSLGVSLEREHRHTHLSVYLLTCIYALRLTATQDNGKCSQPLSWCFTFYAFSVHGTQSCVSTLLALLFVKTGEDTDTKGH